MKPRPKSVLTFLGAALLVSACQVRTPALDTVLARYPALNTGIYEDLGTWESVFGQPKTVPQNDSGETFFYWPEHGIAVFTHPLYEGQFRSRPEKERIVTSVIIPLRQSIHPDFLPVQEEVVIHFDRLIHLGDEPHRCPESGRGQGGSEVSAIDVVSSPFRKTTERLHCRGTKPIAIEIRDTWWLSHYD